MDLIRVATGPDSDPDNIIARKVDPSKHEPADKTVGTNPTGIRSEDSGVDENTVACAMDDDRGHVDEPVTSEGQNVPPGFIQPGEVEMTPEEWEAKEQE